MTDKNFWDVRKEFLGHLRYTRGASMGTCYGYNSDLGIWGKWLEDAHLDWKGCSYVEVEQWITVQMRDTGVRERIVLRRVSALATFYKWAVRNRLVATDPVYLAEKPKLPHRIPVWMEREEQERFKAALHDNSDLPETVFGILYAFSICDSSII